jgi:heme exporter protein CcmD
MPTFDKYAPYIFSSYAIAAVVLGGIVLWSIWRIGHARKKLDAIEKDGEASPEKKP